MVFIDTNVFVYAHDKSDPVKFEAAKALIIAQVCQAPQILDRL